jgi:hypothetical protein
MSSEKNCVTISDQEEIKHLRKDDRERLSVLSRNEFDPKLVAWYHREMFHLHDLKQWDSLKENAREMIVALGYNREHAEKASSFVLEAYRNADLAAKAQEEGNIDNEIISYNRALDNFISASRSAGSDMAGLKYKIGWYKSERHNRVFLVAYYLFREHLERFGILRLDVVISTTWVAFWGGYFAHKQHDWKGLESVMVKYWKYVHSVYPIRPPLQI